MLKVLIYSYSTGVFSSRRIARKLHEDVAFRVLSAGNFPAHRTISEFRKRHLEDFESIFVQLLSIAREVGLFAAAVELVEKESGLKQRGLGFGSLIDLLVRASKRVNALE